jgi:uncharacterized protein YjbJ (UPF0337 family)
VTTSPGQVAGATQQAAGQTAATAKDEAAQVTHVAASAASDVAGTAKQQAGQVAGEAVNQLRSLTDEARGQATQQVNNATDKLSTTVRSWAGEVRDLSQGKGDGSSPIAGLAQQLADKGEQLADYISAQGPSGLVQELRTFAQRRPGTFLLGALAAGVATGRLVKGATASSTPSTSSTPSALPPAGGYASDLAPSGYRSQPADTAPAYGSTGYSSDTAETTAPYPGAVPVVHSDDTGVLDDDTSTIGAVSGDQRLMAERLRAAEPGSGLR